jgi:RNA polymerase sigma factor (sigma-70 family)
MIPEPDEYGLARRAREGDPGALSELVERTRLGLFRLAYGLLGNYDDANDAVAAALLQVCLHVRTLREPATMTAWMQRIVRNEVYRLGRRRVVEAEPQVEAAAPEGLTVTLLRLDIERALRQLSPNQARVIRLFYLEERTVEEIARQTAHPAGTIKSWLYRGRRRLCDEMEGYAPMAPTAPELPTQPMALVHTDLTPEQLRTIADAVAAGQYQLQIIEPTDMEALVSSLAGYQALILDEQLNGHSAFELLIHVKSEPLLQHLPVCVLASNPTAFTTMAYFNAGVDRLVNKDDPEELGKLAAPLEKRAGGSKRWNGLERFTDRARRAILYAEEEAVRRRTDQVEPEHLLLGMLREPDCLAGRIMDRLGAEPAQVREAVKARLTRGEGKATGRTYLSPRSQQVIGLSAEEAERFGHNYRGTEHLLLGLLAEQQGEAWKILTEPGLTPERVRAAAETAQRDFSPLPSTS